jgi:hypothetical protein
VVLGAWGGTADRNPATSPAVLAGGAAREELGVARARFACLVETERRPESTSGGVRRRAPRERSLR